MPTAPTDALGRFGLDKATPAAWIGSETRKGSGAELRVRSPIDGSTLAILPQATAEDVEAAARAAGEAFRDWRLVPAPKRGEFVRRLGNALRDRKAELAELVTLEAGKITQEALGEVQEMIDICDFAVGLSRQLYGLTIASERPGHRMMEQWHPLGPVGVISAFNFPVAVWSWNAALAFVCGDPVIWKPSEKTPLTALACQSITQDVVKDCGWVPPGVSSVLVGDAKHVGIPLCEHHGIPLISATGSVRMGREVAKSVGGRLGKTLLELGGNNAMIVTPTADLNLALRAIIFAAFGTAGQRCTTLRRLIVHESVREDIAGRIKRVMGQLKIGDPRTEGVLVGPLIDEQAFEGMEKAIAAAKQQGGKVSGGGRVKEGVPAGGVYARPALVEIAAEAAILQQETFAPVLYVIGYRNFEEAIAVQNGVPQGLSSAVFTGDVREAELFCSPAGSDCGIANVNIGTSGAEIGGAFGGEKETGGGRESGSDSWKNYMRRATNTINYSTALPLAQGINFDIGGTEKGIAGSDLAE